MAAAAKLMEELRQNRVTLSQQPISNHKNDEIAQLTAFQPQQSMHPIMSAAQQISQQPSYPSMSSGQQFFPLPFMPTQPFSTHTLPSTEQSNNIYSYIQNIEMMRLLAGRR